MINKIEEAIISATVAHSGRKRKLWKTPFILHPLEVAEILSNMTDDEDIIAAGILHDIVGGGPTVRWRRLSIDSVSGWLILCPPHRRDSFRGEQRGFLEAPKGECSLCPEKQPR